MASEIHTTLRYLDELYASDQITELYKRGISALHNFDKEQDYESSVELLERLANVAANLDHTYRRNQFLGHLQSRCLLIGKHDKARSIADEIERKFQSPLSLLIEPLIGGENEKVGQYIIENIEKQTIFGNFTTIDDIPYLHLTSSEDIRIIIEKYYSPGLYNINLLDSSTSLHQSITIEYGDIVEDVNLVEREVIFKLEG